MISAAKQFGVEWEGAGLPEAPTAPETLKESGLTAGFLNDMILRTLYSLGGMLGLELSRFLRLPFKVIEDPLCFLKEGHGFLCFLIVCHEHFPLTLYKHIEDPTS